MKRKLALLAFPLALLSCGDGEPGVDPDSKIEIDSKHFRRVTIDGMPCLIWTESHYLDSNSGWTYSGITCDWSDQ